MPLAVPRRLLFGLLAVFCAACTSEPEVPPAPPAPELPPPAAAEAPEDTPDDGTVEALFARLQEAVRAGDREAFAALARFPLGGLDVDREAFFDTYYGGLFDEGPFRDALLAAGPDDLEPTDDGAYAYHALVAYTEAGEIVDADDPRVEGESSMTLHFRPDEAGRWQLTEVWLAG